MSPPQPLPAAASTPDSSVPAWLRGLLRPPEYHPTESEFVDPMTDGHLFNNISLGGRVGNVSPPPLPPPSSSSFRPPPPLPRTRGGSRSSDPSPISPASTSASAAGSSSTAWRRRRRAASSSPKSVADCRRRTTSSLGSASFASPWCSACASEAAVGECEEAEGEAAGWGRSCCFWRRSWRSARRRRWISRASISARRRSLRIMAIITAEEVLLRDSSDENVIPVVEELRRRLAPSSATQHDGKENLSGQHDVEGAEEDGRPSLLSSWRSTLHWSPASSSSCGKTINARALQLQTCNVRYFLNVIFNILSKKIYNYFPYPYLVSVIHLFVDVVYCLVSWTVGLPKRVGLISCSVNVSPDTQRIISQDCY